jgi:hypothetical protein
VKETCSYDAFPQRNKKGIKKGNLANHTSVQPDAARLSAGAALLIHYLTLPAAIIDCIYTAYTVVG